MGDAGIPIINVTSYIKDCMIFETRGERRVTLTMMILLYNLRARAVGINQLKSVYTAPLDRNANIEFVGLWPLKLDLP